VKAVFRAHGRVQGVGFRWFVLHQAQDLDLSGWARNEPDGTVSGEAQGDFSRLEAFREILEGGAAPARVSRLDWNLTEDGRFLPHPFEIRP
jgi:acylphosphatase